MAPKEMFTIVNSVRRVETRIRRAASPTHARFKQYVCGRRLLRKQSIKVPREEVERYEKQLIGQLNSGAIRIFDPEGKEIFPPGYQAPGRPVVHSTGIKTLKGAKGSSKKPPAPETKKAEPEEVPEPEAEPEKAEEPEAAAEPEPEVTADASDDLTTLPNIGGGRVKKLTEAGISRFEQLAKMPPAKLVKILGAPLTEAHAVAICRAASEKVS